MKMDPLLSVEGLKKHYPIRTDFFGKPTDFVRAVDGVHLKVRKGETLGLVGESGCGKSTLGRCILRLEQPTDGRVFFQGQDILGMDRASLRRMRRQMQIIFQDPFSSLNPRKTAEQIVGDGFSIHSLLTPEQRSEKVRELLTIVGLAQDHAARYPHEFSGGQRQRISIARAIALNPALIIADEPVSALDVSIQAQVLNLMVLLQRQFDLTYIFISHDLSVVRHISDRIAVMYLGRIVELAPTQDLYEHPYHPYTEALISALPAINPAVKQKRIKLTGDVPSPINPPRGCAFHPRCPYYRKKCSEKMPAPAPLEGNRMAACFFPRRN